jgi:hypothetical protein
MRLDPEGLPYTPRQPLCSHAHVPGWGGRRLDEHGVLPPVTPDLLRVARNADLSGRIAKDGPAGRVDHSWQPVRDG